MKIGTGIGAGIIADDLLLRGYAGAAGDLGHTRASNLYGAELEVCRCGNLGCVEAYAGGWGIARDLARAGRPVADAHDVVRLVREGDYEAVRLVRRAGRILGDAIASLVSVLNPHYVVLTDTLARCDELILAGVREHVHAQVAPLATRDLQLLTETREPSIGLSGLAFLVAQHVLIQPSVPR